MRLRTLLGTHPCTAALKDGSVKSETVTLDFADYSPTHKGFKPMIREQAFDASEMAIVTYLMAKSFGKPMALLPNVVMARFQPNLCGCPCRPASRRRVQPAQQCRCRQRLQIMLRN